MCGLVARPQEGFFSFLLKGRKCIETGLRLVFNLVQDLLFLTSSDSLAL